MDQILRGIGRVHRSPHHAQESGTKIPRQRSSITLSGLSSQTQRLLLTCTMFSSKTFIWSSTSAGRQSLLAAGRPCSKAPDIADALYASGIYCDGDGVYFSSQVFLRVPRMPPSTVPRCGRQFRRSFCWRQTIWLCGERSFAPRMWEQYAATGTNAMWHLISAYQRTEEMIKFRFEGGNGLPVSGNTTSWLSWNLPQTTALLSAQRPFTPSPAIGLRCSATTHKEQR